MTTEDASDREAPRRWLLLGTLAAGALLLVAFVGLRHSPTESSLVTARHSPKPQATVERHPPALPIDADPLEVAQTYVERWDAGDVAGYEALVAPTANLFTQDAAPEVAIESWYRIATGVTLERTCELVAADRVRCETTFVSGLRPGEVIADREEMVLVIEDGQIVEFVFPHGFRPVYDDDAAGLVAYREWMQSSEPQVYNSLFLSPETIVVNSEEARQQHRDLIARFHQALASRID